MVNDYCSICIGIGIFCLFCNEGFFSILQGSLLSLASGCLERGLTHSEIIPFVFDKLRVSLLGGCFLLEIILFELLLVSLMSRHEFFFDNYIINCLDVLLL